MFLIDSFLVLLCMYLSLAIDALKSNDLSNKCRICRVATVLYYLQDVEEGGQSLIGSKDFFVLLFTPSARSKSQIVFNVVNCIDFVVVLVHNS